MTQCVQTLFSSPTIQLKRDAVQAVQHESFLLSLDGAESLAQRASDSQRFILDSGCFQWHAFHHQIQWHDDNIQCRSNRDGSRLTIHFSDYLSFIQQHNIEFATTMTPYLFNANRQQKQQVLSIAESWLNQCFDSTTNAHWLAEQMLSTDEEQWQLMQLQQRYPVSGFCFYVTEEANDWQRLNDIDEKYLRVIANVTSYAQVQQAKAANVDFIIGPFLDVMCEQGQAIVGESLLTISDSQHQTSWQPLSDDCNCETCQTNTRAYLHHLWQHCPLLAKRNLLAHNFFQVFSE